MGNFLLFIALCFTTQVLAKTEIQCVGKKKINRRLKFSLTYAPQKSKVYVKLYQKNVRPIKKYIWPNYSDDKVVLKFRDGYEDLYHVTLPSSALKREIQSFRGNIEKNKSNFKVPLICKSSQDTLKNPLVVSWSSHTCNDPEFSRKILISSPADIETIQKWHNQGYPRDTEIFKLIGFSNSKSTAFGDLDLYQVHLSKRQLQRKGFKNRKSIDLDDRKLRRAKISLIESDIVFFSNDICD